MKYLVLFTMLLISCGVKNASHVSTVTVQGALDEKLDFVRSWSQTCGHTACWDTGSGLDTGDGVLFNGLLCLSGYVASCEAVKLAQGADGEWYRSEFYIGAANNVGGNSFSRDQALGVLAYLLVSKDTVAATSWYNYIIRSGEKLCTDDTDGRCIMTPGLFGTMGHVWTAIGLTPTALMVVSETANDTALLIQAATAAIGFNLHLTVVDAFLRQTMGENVQEVFNEAYKRQPLNGFFMWCALGSTDAVANYVLSLVPVVQPLERSQWNWQRDTAEADWNTSMGWDFVFMINELLKP